MLKPLGQLNNGVFGNKELVRLCGRIASVIVVFMLVFGEPLAYAQQAGWVSPMPVAGTMVGLSATSSPALLRGLVIDPNKPLDFQFLVDPGKNALVDQQKLRLDSERMVKYFMAAVTVPEGDLWVNLSPVERDRIIPDALGKTEMGREMLAQDYLLKQLTATLLYPEEGVGKLFWKRVYEETYKKFGTTDVPAIDTFNKVWIQPDQAEIYEKGHAVYVTGGHLQVMLDADLAAQKAETASAEPATQLADNASTNLTREISRQVLREVLLPAIEQEVNQGSNFAALRQVFYAAILAKWYRNKIADTLLADAYVGKSKVKGIDHSDPQAKVKVYEEYIAAYRKGVYSFIKEETDPGSGEVIPRKYFSGGENLEIPQLAQARALPEGLGPQYVIDASMKNVYDTATQRVAKAPLTPNQLQGIDAVVKEFMTDPKLRTQVELLDPADPRYSKLDPLSVKPVKGQKYGVLRSNGISIFVITGFNARIKEVLGDTYPADILSHAGRTRRAVYIDRDIFNTLVNEYLYGESTAPLIISGY
ncbi:MAG: hypothetical protein HQL20_09750, partial [Candidatus Omnitrophica bacterium]|nr:hypothetical protein [Candidatus Omnitrophota bacterium]